MLVKFINGEFHFIDSLNKLNKLNIKGKIDNIFINDPSVYYDDLFYETRLTKKFSNINDYIGKIFNTSICIESDGEDIPPDGLLQIKASVDFNEGINFTSLSDIIHYKTFNSRFLSLQEFYNKTIDNTLKITTCDDIENITGLKVESGLYLYSYGEIKPILDSYIYYPLYGVYENIGFIIHNKVFKIINNINTDWVVTIYNDNEIISTINGWNCTYRFMDLMYYIPQIIDLIFMQNEKNTIAEVKILNNRYNGFSINRNNINDLDSNINLLSEFIKNNI